MEYTPQELEDFKALWKKEVGATLTDAEAQAEAGRLLEFYACLAGRSAVSPPPRPDGPATA